MKVKNVCIFLLIYQNNILWTTVKYNTNYFIAIAVIYSSFDIAGKEESVRLLRYFSLYHPSYSCFYEHCWKRKTLPVFLHVEYRIKDQLPPFRVLHVFLISFQRG